MTESDSDRSTPSQRERRERREGQHAAGAHREGVAVRRVALHLDEHPAPDVEVADGQSLLHAPSGRRLDIPFGGWAAIASSSERVASTRAGGAGDAFWAFDSAASTVRLPQTRRAVRSARARRLLGIGQLGEAVQERFRCGAETEPGQAAGELREGATVQGGAAGGTDSIGPRFPDGKRFLGPAAFCTALPPTLHRCSLVRYCHPGVGGAGRELVQV